ncbi:helix-turn-helix transcriptional regulator [Chryseolinea sp. T2]|uniref:helix-turn-helix transcriptional regulator n=1 Tax=Chryseolinea sp. T2 TaxID=3129255 RepID=UPI00307739D6
MNYQEYIPSESLRSYVKCYYVFEAADQKIINDNAFATGCVEVMFNLQGSRWETQEKGKFTHTAKMELWGQIVRPIPIRLSGNSLMLGIRFHPFGAAIFLNDDVSLFNDNIVELRGVMGTEVDELYEQLQDTAAIAGRIVLLESFLHRRLALHEKRRDKSTLVKMVMNELTRDDFFDNIDNVASRYGITSRYLQKIFLQHTGLTPKLFSKINRFQKSLVLIGKGDLSLTSIAYQSGYFDQSHFIREFKSFTGNTPSRFDGENSSAILASPNK